MVYLKSESGRRYSEFCQLVTNRLEAYESCILRHERRVDYPLAEIVFWCIFNHSQPLILILLNKYRNRLKPSPPHRKYQRIVRLQNIRIPHMFLHPDLQKPKIVLTWVNPADYYRLLCLELSKPFVFKPFDCDLYILSFLEYPLDFLSLDFLLD